MKKMQVYRWHKNVHASVNDEPQNERRMYCKQTNVCQNSPSPQGCSEKEMTGKMYTK
jgi:hypothetical protein